MVELNIVVVGDGVKKTQIYAGDEEQEEGLRLYERVLPHIKQIDATLRSDPLKQETQNERGGE